ncbi:MAG: aspartate aminotransferase family protein [Fimbriimonadales bacterium]|nr:aspartate aminotransferase family protein [Fimbriimonadales bacterium]
MRSDGREHLANIPSPIEVESEDFRSVGHALVDALADHMESLRERPVTRGDDPKHVWTELGNGSLPEQGVPLRELFQRTTELLSENSLFNGHPRFWGYITASPSPVGILADLLASAMNPNCGGWTLSPMASAMELQTVRWLAEFIGYPTSCGGILVSGGNMANMIGFLAARRAFLGEKVRSSGLENKGLTVYASDATHTWLQKASDVFGLGTNALRFVRSTEDRMPMSALREAIHEDRSKGLKPFLIVATAGTVSTGAIDPIIDLSKVAREEGLWLHVDGAYGAPVASLPEAGDDLHALSLADSIALDPHKWLYSPLEAGCVLVKDPGALEAAFSFRPPYYYFHAGEDRVNFYELGLQNSRGFRALKVWMSLMHHGRQGHIQAIRRDIALTEIMRDALSVHSEIEVATCRLSIVTFRFLPSVDVDVNALNEKLLASIQRDGRAFVSNAVIDGKFYLRACIVNFRTSKEDARSLADIVVELGRKVESELAG